MTTPVSMRETLARSGSAPILLLALAILATLAIHAVAVVNAYDDAFITFRYVRNVEDGRGPVYNEGERVLGISNPLYGAWLMLLHFAPPGVELPVLAVRSNGLLLAAAGLLGWLLLLRVGASAWTAALGGAAIILSDRIIRPSIGGMESSMLLALTLGTALACLNRRDGLALFAACLATLVRPEGILLAGLVVGVRLADHETRSLPSRLWFATLPLVIWAVGATLYYGSPIPHSVIAKSRPLYPLPAGTALQNLVHHMGEWTLDGIEVAYRAASVRAGIPITWDRVISLPVLAVTGALITLFGLAGWPRANGTAAARGLLLPGFLLSVLILYGFTNPYLLPWYFPLVHAPWLILVLAGCSPRSTDHGRPAGRTRVIAGRLVASLVCLAAFVPTLAHLSPSDWSLLSSGASSANQAEILGAYQRTAAWVAGHSGPAESVAAPEIGVLGYYLDRRILDACGLVTKEAIPFLPVPIEQRGDQQGVISVDFVRATSPDLVVTLPKHSRPSLLRSEWFSAAYELVHEEPVLHGIGEDRRVLVFRRRFPGTSAPVSGS